MNKKTGKGGGPITVGDFILSRSGLNLKGLAAEVRVDDDGEVLVDVRVEDETDRPDCFASNMGLYLADPRVAAPAAEMILSGQIRAENSEERDRRRRAMGMRVEDGIAIIQIQGTMQRGYSKFGGTSTRAVRRQIAEAVKSFQSGGDIKGIFAEVFSPGGSYFGTQALADDLYAAAQVMPVHTHGEDMMASAAAFVGLQANSVSVNRGGEVGSFGTVMVVQDTSGKMKREGVKVHVISTGDYKGAAFPGAPITAKHLAKFRKEVNEANQHFVEAIVRGRGMPLADVFGLFTGEMFKASDALRLGLVDHVMSDTEALAKMKAGELGKKKIRKSVDAPQKASDTERTQHVVGSETDTPRDATMDEAQIIEFLQSNDTGKKILAEQVQNAVDARIKAGDLVTKDKASEMVAAAVNVEKNAAKDAAEVTKLAREIYAIDETVPLETIEAKLAACETKNERESEARALKAEAKILAAKQQPATKDKSVVKGEEDLDKVFEAKWAAGDFGDPEDAKVKASKASVKSYWMKRQKELSV